MFPNSLVILAEAHFFASSSAPLCLRLRPPYDDGVETPILSNPSIHR
ncbi:hypothetical protein SLEP1_g1445 [Rubroshorea leprosula]|uniref:Uncharacterized protein n=1 Tax=Rubroshorea leprosula TaxID=152421 RepID=A0AAV5HKJ8_9ROSI|nr:hypothetical protein SLEP1_g1445 [Rubroshorea leprosula]